MGTLEGIVEHVIRRGIAEIKEELRQLKAEMDKWLRWIVVFSVGTVCCEEILYRLLCLDILLQILLKVFYYDAKVRRDMEEQLNKTILDGQARFRSEVQEILKKLNVKLENQGKLLNEMNEAIRDLRP